MQFRTVLTDSANTWSEEVTEGKFPRCSAATNLESGFAAVSRDWANGIQKAAICEGEDQSIWSISGP
jgi:hypothetical protein